MKYSQRAFTLVELLITISIFVLITTVAVFSNSQFNSSILLTNLSYEIALSLRQAQVYGITVKSPTSCLPGNPSCDFSSGYGLHFDTTGSPASYILFEDKGPNPDHAYGGSDAIVQNFSIGRGYSIKRLCVLSNGVYHLVHQLDVSFVRPEPEAWISSDIDSPVLTEADIYIKDPSNKSDRKIAVEPTGQISVVNNDSTLCQ